MNEPNVVILAGGISSRMRKSAEAARASGEHLADKAIHMSKSMMTVGSGGRPFLDYLLFNLEQSGYHNLVLVIGERDVTMREQYGDAHRKEFKRLKISFVNQPIPQGRTKPLGTADALLRALEATPEWKGKQLTVCNSDNLYSQKALGLLLKSTERNSMIDYDKDALGFPPERISQFAVLVKDKEDYLKDILEKPSAEEIEKITEVQGNAPGVSMNIFRFSYDEVLPALRETPFHPIRQEKELPEAVRMMTAKDPKAVKTYRLQEYVPDLTTVQDIPAVQQYLKEQFAGMKF